jgi:hypothetical protein
LLCRKHSKHAERGGGMIPIRDNVSAKTKPVVNWLLILLNCYVFYLELHFDNPAALDKFITH